MSTPKTAPPTVIDARTAAGAVAATGGVSEILVFGSVARGEAGPDSDIDLVAIHDDLDYSARSARSARLGSIAAEATGHRVFVYVTDWPEWIHRSSEVTSSLERAISAEAVSLYHRDASGVRWRKEIGMPATDRDEGLVRLDNALRSLLAVQGHLEMSPGERNALVDRDPGYYLFALRGRMGTLCAHAHMAMETSLKALIHIGGTHPARTHDLGRLLGSLPVGERDSLREHFMDVTPATASRWREAGAYESSERPLDEMVIHAYHMVRTCIKLSRHAANRFADSEAARVMGKVSAEIERKVDSWNLEGEDPYKVLGQSPPPELGPR